MSFKYLNSFIKLILLLGLSYLFLLSPKDKSSGWDKVLHRGFLTWVTRPSPLTYYTGLDATIGVEYNILKEFCDFHNLELHVVLADSSNDLFAKLDSGKVDIAGANLALNETRNIKYHSTIPYSKTQVVLVSSLQKNKIILGKDNNISGTVLDNSSYSNIAKQLIEKYSINIDNKTNASLYELLVDVSNHEFDFTLADINLVKMFKSFIPQLRIGEAVAEEQELVFFTQKASGADIKIQLDLFLNQQNILEKIESYQSESLSSLPNSSPADTVNFIRNYNKRWRKIRKLIYKIAEQEDIDPILLGAISYQESHWNPEAVSPTLVKGLMMLTKGVALEQNVEDRLNPEQSLVGGVRHFKKMMKKIPERITEPDRTQMALASYNIGYGNLERARVLAQKAGRDPDLWIDVAKHLPELNQMKNRKADGKTAVGYVENISVYQNLLNWKEQNRQESAEN